MHILVGGIEPINLLRIEILPKRFWMQNMGGKLIIRIKIDDECSGKNNRIGLLRLLLLCYPLNCRKRAK
jgi:hypothetical protein